MGRNTSARETGQGRRSWFLKSPAPGNPSAPHPFLLPTLSARDVCSSLRDPGEIRRRSPLSADAGPNASPRLWSHNVLGETAGWESGGPGLLARHVPGPGERWITGLSFLLKGRGLEEGHTDTPDMGRSSRQLGGCSVPTQKGG